MPEFSTRAPERDFLYTLNKQLPTARSLETYYGVIELDDEMLHAVIEALTPILERRIQAGGEVHDA